MIKVSPITWQTRIVDPKTGYPTKEFIDIWQAVLTLSLSGLLDVNVLNPVDGAVLTYNAAQKKWIASP